MDCLKEVLREGRWKEVALGWGGGAEQTEGTHSCRTAVGVSVPGVREQDGLDISVRRGQYILPLLSSQVLH